MHGSGAIRPTEARTFSNDPSGSHVFEQDPSGPLKRSSSGTGAFQCAWFLRPALLRGKGLILYFLNLATKLCEIDSAERKTAETGPQ